MRKIILISALMAVAAIALTGCEKSKDEPQMPLPPSKDVKAVDLGLSVKWANMNIGATNPEEYGAYFAWGETSPKTTYNCSTYFDTKDGGSTFIKYNNNEGKTVLDLADDAAHVNWGGNWRMPTKAEIKELISNCTWTLTTQNGVNGSLVTSKKNGNSIFLPASGLRDGSSLYNVASDGLYWSSSLHENSSSRAYFLHFNDGYVVGCYNIGRDCGQSVRPVCQ